MLVLSRKVGESIIIDNNIVITIHAIKGGRVRLAMEAPRDIRVRRGELKPLNSAQGADPHTPTPVPSPA